MKKVLAVLSSAMVLAASVSTTAFAVGDEYDFNGDGVTNSMDMSVYRKYLMTDGGTKEYEGSNDSGASSGYSKNFDEYFKNIELTDDAIAKIAALGDSLDYNDLINKFFEEGFYVTDVNKDGKFDINDPQLILQYFADISTGRVSLTDEQIAFIVENCNYSGEHQVDSLDASILVSRLRTVLRTSYKIGDTNLDGAVDAIDASNVLTLYAKSQTGGLDSDQPDEYTYVRMLGDMNDDGKADALDASLILSSYASAQTK